MEYKVDKKVIEQIIVGDDPQKLVEEAEKLGRFLAKDTRPPLSTSQIRMVFGTVKKVSQVWTPQISQEDSKPFYRQILLLKPKLAYQEGRVRSDAIRAMKNTLDDSIDLIQNDAKRFKRFAEFFEAILAYHKAYGGK